MIVHTFIALIGSIGEGNHQNIIQAYLAIENHCIAIDKTNKHSLKEKVLHDLDKDSAQFLQTLIKCDLFKLVLKERMRTSVLKAKMSVV